MGPAATSPTATTKSTPKSRTMSTIATAADRTAAARAASAAKRAAAKNAKAAAEKAFIAATPPRAPTGSVEADVKKERQSDAEGIEEDTQMGGGEVEEEEMEVPEEKKIIKRRKPGKKRRSVVKRRQSAKKSTVQDEQDKGETADDISTIESEATAPTAADDDEDVSDMDVDMEVFGTPKGVRQPKRKRQGSTPPPAEGAMPIPTVSPILSATALAPPPPPLVQQKSNPTSSSSSSPSSSSSSSSLSQIVAPSPSPVSFLPPRTVSTVGQQVQVIATKKFQQLSAPLLHNISAHRFANLFMAPVGERVAPGYSRLVYRPMDLKSMPASYSFISLAKF